MFLVELHAEELLEQRGEPERLDAQKLRGNSRVEDVVDVPPIILMQQPQVVVGVVKHDLHFLILQNVAEGLRHPDRQRVDDRAPFARSDLQEIDSVDEPVKAGSLGIDSNLANARDIREKVVCLLLRVYVQ